MPTSKTNPSPERSKATAASAGPDAVVPVNITRMPPSKPLLKDSSRLLSLAALIFSVVTGSFATLQSARTSRETTIDTINKLIDQYYGEQEKLATMNEQTQIDLMNLLRSRAQAAASRIISLTNTMYGYVDDRTWSAVAQINDRESNFQIAETAWLTTISTTHDISTYLYATRQLASNQFHQFRKDDADRLYRSALDSALSDRVKGRDIVNIMPENARFSEAALTHAYWLDQFKRKDCPFVVPHFDSALELIGNVSRSNLIDLESQRRIVSARELLNKFRRVREACDAPLGTALADDKCNLVANIVDNAADFAIYKGALDNERSAYRSRVFLPDSEFCGIQKSIFYCTWPASGRAATRARFDGLIEMLSNCKHLRALTANDAGVAAGSLQDVVHLFPDSGSITIKMDSLARLEGADEWKVTLEIDPDAQR